MSVFRCKMCGAGLDFENESNVVCCEYCGSKQTIPRADNEKKVNMFNRANKLRMFCEFDKANILYQNIISEFFSQGFSIKLLLRRTFWIAF